MGSPEISLTWSTHQFTTRDITSDIKYLFILIRNTSIYYLYYMSLLLYICTLNKLILTRNFNFYRSSTNQKYNWMSFSSLYLYVRKYAPFYPILVISNDIWSSIIWGIITASLCNFLETRRCFLGQISCILCMFWLQALIVWLGSFPIFPPITFSLLSSDRVEHDCSFIVRPLIEWWNKPL